MEPNFPLVPIKCQDKSICISCTHYCDTKEIHVDILSHDGIKQADKIFVSNFCSLLDSAVSCTCPKELW